MLSQKYPFSSYIIWSEQECLTVDGNWQADSKQARQTLLGTNMVNDFMRWNPNPLFYPKKSDRLGSLQITPLLRLFQKNKGRYVETLLKNRNGTPLYKIHILISFPVFNTVSSLVILSIFEIPTQGSPLG